MENVCLIKETPQLCNILNDSYAAILAALCVESPNAKSLIESETYGMLHDCLALIKTGQLSVRWLDGEESGRYMALSIREE